MSEASKLQRRTWSKDHYLISTDPSLVPLDKLNAAFASPDIHWALPLPVDALSEMLQRSMCFGLYAIRDETVTSGSESDRDFIGFARCVTDFTTFAYLTDVYIWPAHQGRGLGKWLITCIREVLDSMPYLRRSLLFTSDWKRSVPFYRELMGMEVVPGLNEEGGGLAIMRGKGKGLPPGL